jgi:hypothetical protein
MKPIQVSRFLSWPWPSWPRARQNLRAGTDDARAGPGRGEWYNEGYGRLDRQPARLVRSRGVWSPEFRRFMMEAAARERQKWGPLIPGNGGGAASGDPPTARRRAAASAG